MRTGDGLKELRETLASGTFPLPPPRDIGKARLFVDRAFSLPGIGTVVTGTLTGGILQKDDEFVAGDRDDLARANSILA